MIYTIIHKNGRTKDFYPLFINLKLENMRQDDFVNFMRATICKFEQSIAMEQRIYTKIA